MPHRPNAPSEAARAQQAPLPPEVLADALQDRIHEELPGVRSAKSLRARREPWSTNKLSPGGRAMPGTATSTYRLGLPVALSATADVAAGAGNLPRNEGRASEAREERLRCLGFEEVSPEQRERNLSEILDHSLGTSINYGCADALMAVLGMRRVEK